MPTGLIQSRGPDGRIGDPDNASLVELLSKMPREALIHHSGNEDTCDIVAKGKQLWVGLELVAVNFGSTDPSSLLCFFDLIRPNCVLC